MRNKFLIVTIAALSLTAASCVKTAQSPTTEQPSATSTPQASTIKVFQTVEASNLNNPAGYTVAEGKTAMDLLKMSHQVDVKTYSGIGDMVTGIDGNKPDSKHFWSFFVNGKSSDVGASTYVLKNGDTIAWKLDKIN